MASTNQCGKQVCGWRRIKGVNCSAPTGVPGQTHQSRLSGSLSERTEDRVGRQTPRGSPSTRHTNPTHTTSYRRSCVSAILMAVTSADSSNSRFSRCRFKRRSCGVTLRRRKHTWKDESHTALALRCFTTLFKDNLHNHFQHFWPVADRRCQRFLACKKVLQGF